MKRLSVVCLLLAVVLLAGCTQMSAEEIAKKMEEKYNSVKDFRGIIRTTSEGPSGKIVTECEYVFKKPNKFLMHDKNRGLLMVSNGKTVWIYDEKRNEVMISNITMSSHEVNPDYGKFVRDMLEKYDVKLLGSEKVSNRDCYVIQLTPKKAKLNKTIKMWVDKEFWYPLKIVYQIGEIKSTLEYIDVKFNTGVSDDIFEFKPPKGAKIVKNPFKMKRFKSVEEAQECVDFKILKPTYTAGYELKEVVVLSDTVVLNYYNESKDVLTISESNKGSLPEMPNAEKVKIGNEEGLFLEIYGSKMLTFKRDEVVITISAKLSKEELIKIAESME